MRGCGIRKIDPTLATLPSKQGLKRRDVPFCDLRHCALATLPSKQGLKPLIEIPIRLRFLDSRYTSIKTRIETQRSATQRRRWATALATLPSKQGLKPYTSLVRSRSMIRSRYTSIKTRIETLLHRVCLLRGLLLSLHFHQNKDWNTKTRFEHLPPAPSRYTSIKTRIETSFWGWGRPPHPCSRYTSIKTRIETRSVNTATRPQHPLATLPSKQGLKLVNEERCESLAELSLHFHQNKDWNSVRFRKTRLQLAVGLPLSLHFHQNKDWNSVRFPLARPLFPVLSLHFHQNKDWNVSWLDLPQDPSLPLATLPSKQGLKPGYSLRRKGCVVNSRYTSIKTRIETAWVEDVLEVSFSSRYTSIKTRIETYASKRHHQPQTRALATLPSKQGLKPDVTQASHNIDTTLATLPSKQGLKLDVADNNVVVGHTLATLPSKQGLKRVSYAYASQKAWNSRYTSIKTRIETYGVCLWFVVVCALATLPSKQGLKHLVEVLEACSGGHSRYTSIKTRIETW